MPSFASVCERVPGDVRDVLVRKRVNRLFASATACDEAGRPQHAEVLRSERLRDPQGVYELVHATRVLGELEHDRQAVRRAEGAKQLRGHREPGLVERRSGGVAGNRHMYILASVHEKLRRALPRHLCLLAGISSADLAENGSHHNLCGPPGGMLGDDVR